MDNSIARSVSVDGLNAIKVSGDAWQPVVDRVLGKSHGLRTFALKVTWNYSEWMRWCWFDVFADNSNLAGLSTIAAILNTLIRCHS